MIAVRLTLITFLALLQLLQHTILPTCVSGWIWTWIVKTAMYIFNSRITIHGDKRLLEKSGLLIMANHYSGIDFPVIASMFDTSKIYTVVKSDLINDPANKHILATLLASLNSAFMRALHFIPYKRGNREDGALVKNAIVDKLNEGHNVLIFPEGTTHRDGVPKEFKQGIFHLVCDNKLPILPITLKYTKDIGAEPGDPLVFATYFDTEVAIYLHDVMEAESDAQTLRERVFKTICDPVTQKVEPVGQT